MKDYSKFVFPAVLILAGILFLGIGASKDQNSLFMIGSAAIAGAGVISLLGALGILNKGANMGALAVLILGSIGLTALDYKSIKDPVDFMNEKERRYKYVIQNLKDIRTAQLAYKSSKGVYATRFDSLINFVRLDSFKVVKAIGMVPDTLTEMEALELGLVSRDTTMAAVQDSIFGTRYLKDHHGEFFLDSLPYVPFGGGATFDMQTGEIERGSVSVQVFQVMDSKPFDKKQVLKVGSLADPSTSGNWE